MTFGGEKSSGLIKGVQFGAIMPGVSVAKTMELVSSGAPGDRTIDVSVQSNTTVRTPSQARAPSPSPSEVLEDVQNADTTEILRTLLIPTSSAFVVRQDVVYQRSLQPPPALTELSVLEDAWEACGEAVVTTVIECAAECGVEVERMSLSRVVRMERRDVLIGMADLVRRRVGMRGWWTRRWRWAWRGCFLTVRGVVTLPTWVFLMSISDVAEYLAGDQFSDVCRITLAETEDEAGEVVLGPGEYVLTWKRYGRAQQLLRCIH